MNGEQVLSQAFIQSHPIDTARLLEQLDVEEIAPFLAEIPPELAAELVKIMNPLISAKCLESIDAALSAGVIEKLSVEIAAVLLRQVEAVQQAAILKALSAEVVEAVTLLLKFPENIAGALMDPQVFTLSDELTVKEALRLIRKQPEHIFYHVPVIDDGHKLLGAVNMRELMLASPEAPITSVMRTGVGRLSSNSNREAILAHPDWQIYHDLPVVDEKGIFLGMLSYQTARRLENEMRGDGGSRVTYDAGRALGELYWIGLSAFFKGAASAVNPSNKPETKNDESKGN